MEFSNINIEADDTEIERYRGDGLQTVVVDCGDSNGYVDDLRSREFDIVVVPPTVPLSLFEHYEPKVIIFTDGSSNETDDWREVTLTHFTRKVPLVTVGDSKDEMLNILGNATTSNDNNTDFGIYTFDEWSDDALERAQYLAVHFNMQDNTYWDQ